MAFCSLILSLHKFPHTSFLLWMPMNAFLYKSAVLLSSQAVLLNSFNLPPCLS